MRILMFFLIFLTGVSFAPLAPAADEASAKVDTLHTALLEAMKGGAQLGFAGRRDHLEPVLQSTFDFDTISRLVTGRHWGEMDEAERKAFVEVFSALSAATYAENFDSFGGQRFETRGTRSKGKAEIVRTVIISSDGDETSLDYLLTQERGEWRIVNVVADGVSDISLKRSEYATVIGQEGITGLIAKLKAKVASYGDKNS
jgi:phospholipid transport system substrate-binding protein